MNAADLWSIARAVLIYAGGILVSRGILDQGQVSTIVDALLTAAGVLLPVASIVWSTIRNRQVKAAVINAAVTQIPEMPKVTSPTKPGA